MARTTIVAVKKILAPGKDYDTIRNPDLEPFIETASVLIDDAALCATNKGASYSETKARLLEGWVAAHCYVTSDQTFASKSTAGASATMHGQTAFNLSSSRYGQMALSLDTSGCLAQLTGGTDGTRRTARGIWLGKPPSEQIPLAQRD